MKTIKILLKRNISLFFKDKGLFFTSLITPLILLVLYVSFLGNVYYDSFMLSIPEGIDAEDIINGCVGGQLLSSLLAVCCVTVAFCSNMLMVTDKVNGAADDIAVSPVNRSYVALAYYIASYLSTLLVCFVATGAGFVYMAVMGWYLTVFDVFLILLDIAILVMFGTALSSIINFFLSSQGQISAVGTIVSSCYGFICGAYMPISQFNEGLQTIITLLPGTYATSLIRNHCMNGALNELENIGLPESAIEEIRSAVDCNIVFFEQNVSIGTMYAIILTTVAILITAYILLNKFKGSKVK